MGIKWSNVQYLKDVISYYINKSVKDTIPDLLGGEPALYPSAMATTIRIAYLQGLKHSRKQ